MAGFGGSVKLTGEDEYKNALKQITQGLREVSSQLVLTATKYDSNDKSLSNLTKKQNELNQAYTTQKKYVEDLRSAYTSFASKVQEQAQAHQKLADEYNEEKAELDRLEKTVGTTSQEYQDQKAKVDDLKNALAKSRQEQQQNENALSRMGTALNKAETDLVKTGKEVDGLTKEIEEAQKPTEELGDELEDAGKKAENSANGGFTVFKGILANLGTQAINSAINGLKNLGSAFVSIGKQALDNYADYEQLVGGIETLFGAGGLSFDEWSKENANDLRVVALGAKEVYNSLKEVEDVVLNNANNAYKTAGLSANEYMQTITSFAAALNSATGDVAVSAEYADMAITDMADNANKMGTSMEMIQNAYQGFAKQNYTMLDNLKLGYGGTKTEMERLIADANKVKQANGEMADLSIDSFADITEAIHIIQNEMGITGTTAKEASETISGSVSSMKSAWSNLLTGIADDNANFEQLIDNFVNSILTVGKNIMPRIKTIVKGIGQMVSQLLTQLVPQLIKEIPPLITETLPILIDSIQVAIQSILDVLPQVIESLSTLIPSIVTMLVNMLPQLVDTGIKLILSLVTGIASSLPKLIPTVVAALLTIVDTLLDNIDLIVDAGIELIMGLADGLLEALPELIEKAPIIIDKLINAITNNLPKLIEAGIELTIKLAEGLIKALPQLLSKVPQIMTSYMNGITSYYSKIGEIGKNLLIRMINGIGSMFGSLGQKASEIGTTIMNKIKELPENVRSIGENLVRGIWQGISGSLDWIKNKIKGWCGDVVAFCKKVLGINSPSKVMADGVGKFMALGIGQGFEDEMGAVTRQMQDSIPTEFDTNTSINGITGTSSANSTNVFSYQSIVSAFEEALANMKIELDDEEAGRFVRKTVEKAIYT